MDELQTWTPLLATTGTMLALSQVSGRGARHARAIAALLCVALASRYLWWRYAMSLPDQSEQNPAQIAWTWLFLVTETMAAMTSMAMFGWMSRTHSRSADADRGSGSPMLAAPVDVLIATYDEPYDILERTIISATRMRHPDLRTWVLDDGARPWVRQLAHELGAEYVSRVRGKHAKAGNINNGLAHVMAIGRKPEFIVLLDADFTVNSTFLERTLSFFEAPDVGIVQTPQHFFNTDPVQDGLLCAEMWPDEQRFFFNYLLEAKDAWGAAFCCGTSAVIRVEALLAAGGMATETVTEDMLTTFKLKELGYRTVFLNENLSMGLAPESLQEYTKQRSRWCLGSIQQLYTRWSFVGAARVGLINRLSCLDAAGYWIFTFPFKLMLITAPLVFWWTGTSVVNADAVDILFWLAPSVAASVSFFAIYAGNRIMPIMTDVSQLLSAFTIAGTVGTAIIKPWGHPFKVTTKGRTTDCFTVHWGIALPFAMLITLTLFGMLTNLSAYSPSRIMPGYGLNVIWSTVSIVIMSLAIEVSVEAPKQRVHERFVADEPALLAIENSQPLNCAVCNISIGGAQLRLPADCPEQVSGAGHLTFVDGVSVPCRIVRKTDNELSVSFDDDTRTRRVMIARLFTGRYHKEVEHVSAWNLLRIWHRALLR